MRLLCLLRTLLVHLVCCLVLTLMRCAQGDVCGDLCLMGGNDWAIMERCAFTYAYVKLLLCQVKYVLLFI